MKKLSVATLTYSNISIYYNSEYDEYQVRVKGNKNATYYTNNKNDALRTAQIMRNSHA